MCSGMSRFNKRESRGKETSPRLWYILGDFICCCQGQRYMLRLWTEWLSGCLPVHSSRGERCDNYASVEEFDEVFVVLPKLELVGKPELHYRDSLCSHPPSPPFKERFSTLQSICKGYESKTKVLIHNL